jgi:hypothetical protein
MNRSCANFAVSGVAGGHYIRMESWFEAATFYNKLYQQGKIIRVDSQ